MDENFLNPDEEFELMYADELEVMNEFDDENFVPPNTSWSSKSKRSLNFTSPSEKNENCETNQLATTLIDANNCITLPNNSGNQHDIHSDDLVATQTNSRDEQIHDENSEIGLNLGTSLSQTTNAKRKFEDLFGDIDDIDFGDDFEDRNNKKSKTDGENLENDLTEQQRMDITIEKILAARQQKKDIHFPMNSLGETNREIRKENKLEISRKVPNYQFISMVGSCNEKLYLRFRTEDLFNSEIEEMSSQTRLGGLLNVPFKKIQEEAAALLQKKWDRMEKESAEPQGATDVANGIPKISEESLWVEKYRPRRYLDLLSDEGTNKSLLKWLKLWDKIVFNRENKIKIRSKYEEKGKFGNRFKKKVPESELDDELDELGRPKFKIALLCGPPGLGKTTLAHILARHAGYNVVEVNASDDRTPEHFRTQLQAATQMKAVLGKDPRPNCLVLDEIDGAPQASIDVLVKFATAKEPMKGKGGKKKKSDLTGILKRPIICICNDVYVPALRPLRLAAYILHFPPTCSYRLAQRLCEISKLQNLKTDLGAMMALSEKTNNDIRACLALLHCLHSKSGNVVRLAHINNATLGTKDIQKGLFTVWQEIFQIKNSNRWKSTLHTVQVCGDYDRLAQGVYENYIAIKQKGFSLKLISEGMDWFVHYDILSSAIHSTQNYTVYSYLPFPFLKWHYLFAGRIWPKISFPTLSYEISSRVTKAQGILDGMLQGMSPAVRPYERRETLLLDVLSLLLEIIVPNLRPVNVQLYSDQEKQDLNKVVNIMLDYNLCYVQERSQDGNYSFNLDPNIEEVAKFPGWKPLRILGYAGRQQVQRAIDLEKFRRLEASIQLNNTNSVNNKLFNMKENSSKDGLTSKIDDKPKVIPNHLQKLTPKPIAKPMESVYRDFFGRVIEKQNTTGDGIINPGKDIWFRFKEGYNNAVRLRVNMSDLY